MLTNGGIHAREWQSPETVTGILEYLATAPSDRHLVDYLRDQVNVVVIPVMNIDGFLQTQRFPTRNWLLTDPNDPMFSPRDGRMRRKNLLNSDEVLASQADHLFGVDLNRNNPPYWDTSGGNNSSDDTRSLVHHGATPHSEPETRALDVAAALGPADQLRVYTDVHSFSMVHFWVRTGNDRLAQQTEQVLDLFSDHHQAFPAGKWYAWNGRFGVPSNRGIGTTDEYFTVNYQVPSWTLEIEPSNGQAVHAPLPGSGADYGGAGVNGHDGFILPEAEIRRVREQLAQTFAAVYFRQSGPPHLQSLRVYDADSDALVFEADWDPLSDLARAPHRQQLQPLEFGRDYVVWLGYSKPMRWLDDGQVTPFPGQSPGVTDTSITALAGAKIVDITLEEPPEVLLEPGGAPDGYRLYRTDASRTTLRIPGTAANRDALAGEGRLSLRIRTRDMNGLGLDADPATVAGWAEGHWVRYEDTLGNATDAGGADQSITLEVSTESVADPFVLEPGIAGAWFDPLRSGEGFIIEMLPDDDAVLYWFTYDDDGQQDWLIAGGRVSGNQLLFDELLRVSGGVFGPGFDPDAVERTVVGAATFTWSGCDSGTMDWHIGNRRGRQSLSRLSRVQGLDCGLPMGKPIRQEAQYSGAWYDPGHSGEGYTLQILEDNSALVYWFSFGPDGARRWFFGEGQQVDGTWVFPELLTTAGPRFGDAFDPEDFDTLPWGTLELDLSCEGGEARYAASETGFGQGSLQLVQLTRQDGPACPP